MKKIRFVPDIVTGRLTEEDAKLYFSRFGLFVLAYTLINSTVQVTAMVVVMRFFPSLYYNYLFGRILPIVAMYAVAFPIAYGIIKPLPTVYPIDDKWSFGELAGCVCVCITIMTGGSYVSNIVVTFLSNLRGSFIENPLGTSIQSMPLWATFLFICVLAPIFEELFFRAFLCKKLLMTGEIYAIILPAAFFALSHGNFYQVFYAFAFGCFFSFIYVRTGKIIYTIVFHMIVNFIGSFLTAIILGHVDLSSILRGEIATDTESLIGLIVLIVYELIIYAAMIAGVVIIIKKMRGFRLHTGILPPPEKKGFTCVMMNGGVAAAIAVLSFSLLGSVL